MKKKQATRRKRQPPKDRVLQARIPEQLDDELRDRAEQLGLSVSTIVRNVLLNTFDLVEGVVADSSHLARTLSGRPASRAEPVAEPPVIGWQEITLAKNGVCDQCNAILPIGERAAVGVPQGPVTTLLCTDCLAELSAKAVATATPAKKKSPRKPRSPKGTG